MDLSEVPKRGKTTLTQSIGRSGVSLFGNLLNRAKSAVSRWWALNRIDPREIEIVAHDLNLSSAELVALMFRPPESLVSLDARLAYEGLSAESLAASHPAELRDLRQVCSRCSSRARCARDIRHKRMATPSKYCPNEPLLRSLAHAQQVHRERTPRVLAFPAKLS